MPSFSQKQLLWLAAPCLLLAGCSHKEKPVYMDVSQLAQLHAGGTGMQPSTEQDGRINVATYFENPTDKEISTITGDLYLYDASGNVERKEVTYEHFTDRATGFTESFLPHSKADGTSTIDLPEQYPRCRFVVTKATCYKSGDDYSDYGHLFAAAMDKAPALQKRVASDRSLATARDPVSQMTLLHVAAAGGNIELVKAILNQGVSIETTAHNGYTPLFEALSTGQSDIAMLLLDRGASFTGLKAKQTALSLACASGSIDVVKALLSKGADPNQMAGPNGTPLAVAAGKGDLDKMKLLLKYGANIKAWDRFCGTILHHAAGSGNPQVVQFLIDRGADVNAITSPNYPLTPLMMAASLGDGRTVRLLLAHGANRNAVGPGGKTAMAYAEEFNNRDAAEALQASTEPFGNTTMPLPPP